MCQINYEPCKTKEEEELPFFVEGKATVEATRKMNGLLIAIHLLTEEWVEY